VKGSTFRRCGCRDPETGKQYPRGKCPRLLSNKRADRDHGSWWGTFDAPRGPDGKRRQVWLGPFETETEADTELATEISRLGAGGHVRDKKLKVADYLKSWLEGKQRSLKPKTWESYDEAVRLYFVPALGHLRMNDLRDHHVNDLVEAMGQINRPLPDGEKPSDLLKRILAVRADDARRELPPGEIRHKKSTKPLSPARIKRIIAVLDSALNAAVKAKKLDTNPRTHVELPRVKKVRPMVWTKPRVQRWLAKGEVPGPVMVWTPKQTGAFLDFAVEERLYSLYHLTAFRGLRRAEIAGLPWTELDLDEGLLTVSETAPDDAHGDPDDPKSEAGNRTLSLDPATIEVLQAWQHRQERECAAAGDSWIDSGKVFTDPDGNPVRPDWISQRFDALIDKYGAIRKGHAEGKTIERLARRHWVSEATVEVALSEPLPPIRYHDLRHGSATLSLAAGVPMKVVSETLGHSKSGFTSDVYTSVIPEVHQAAAEAMAAIVPRNRSWQQEADEERRGLRRPRPRPGRPNDRSR
jgi:integrase